MAEHVLGIGQIRGAVGTPLRSATEEKKEGLEGSEGVREKERGEKEEWRRTACQVGFVGTG